MGGAVHVGGPGVAHGAGPGVAATIRGVVDVAIVVDASPPLAGNSVLSLYSGIIRGESESLILLAGASRNTGAYCITQVKRRFP